MTGHNEITHSTALSVKLTHLAMSISRKAPRHAPFAKDSTPESVTDQGNQYYPLSVHQMHESKIRQKLQYIPSKPDWRINFHFSSFIFSIYLITKSKSMKTSFQSVLIKPIRFSRKFNLILKKQNRIQGYPNCVRVGRSIAGEGNQGRSRRLKKLKNAEKVKRGPTDRPTDIAGYRGQLSRN